jgi:hypothetical protein
VEARNIIVSIEFKWHEPRCVLAYEAVEGIPLPTPGQKKDIYTFRVLDVPSRYSPSAVGDILLEQVRALRGRPGVDYAVAYNIPWVKLRDSSIISEKGMVSLEEAVEFLGTSRAHVHNLLASGRLASTRPPKNTRGQRVHMLNIKDLDYYIDTKVKRGRPSRKDD